MIIDVEQEISNAQGALYRASNITQAALALLQKVTDWEANGDLIAVVNVLEVAVEQSSAAADRMGAFLPIPKSSPGD